MGYLCQAKSPDILWNTTQCRGLECQMLCLLYVNNGDISAFRVQHVHGTAQSRVKGAYEAPHVDGVSHIGHVNADEGLFHGAAFASVVTGITVP